MYQEQRVIAYSTQSTVIYMQTFWLVDASTSALAVLNIKPLTDSDKFPYMASLKSLAQQVLAMIGSDFYTILMAKFGKHLHSCNLQVAIGSISSVAENSISLDYLNRVYLV